jgi:hypothetical protein
MAASSMKPLYELKDKFRCLFCGRGACKHENWRNNPNTPIIGLNCDQITDDLFASQRPSTILIHEYNLVKKFKEYNFNIKFRLNIGLIVNVQRQGEHPYCGPNNGLEQMSGFTYLPEAFTTEGIRVRQSGWKDMNVPDSIDFMVEIVKDIIYTIKEEGRRVLVHCHAGYGRTGVVLACYMLYISTKSAEEVIQEIRERRNQCVQKQSQIAYIKKFQDCIKFIYLDLIRARETFTGQKRDIDFYIKHQLDLMSQSDAHRFFHIPRILLMILERVGTLISLKNYDKLFIYQCLNGNHEWKEDYELILSKFKNSINKGVWDCINETDDILILIELLYDWLDDNITYVINTTNLDYIFKNNFQYELRNMIENKQDYTIDTRKLIIDKFKNDLKMSEFECLSCVANFISNILPDEITDSFVLNEFNLVFDKISIYLLGYSIEMVYDNQDILQAQICQKYVELLRDMLHFFSIVCKYDWSGSYARKNSMNVMSSYLKKLFSENEEIEVLSLYRSDTRILQRLKTQKVIEERINSNNTNKDEFLRNMYGALRTYFDQDVKEKEKTLNGRRHSDDLETYNDFFYNFMDYLDTIKKKDTVTVRASPTINALYTRKQTLKNNTTKHPPKYSYSKYIPKYHSTRNSPKFSPGYSSRYVSPSHKDSPKSILKVTGSARKARNNAIKLRSELTGIALTLKNDNGKEYNRDDSDEKSQNGSSILTGHPLQRQTQKNIKRIQFDLRQESSKNIISFLNNENTYNSKSSYNVVPKTRKAQQRFKNFSNHVLPKM